MVVVHLTFYFFALLAALSAIVVISVSNPVRSVLALVVTFFAMSGIWMLLSAEFLSLILLLVYVGAVMTLFLFVVMMLNAEKTQGGFTRYLPFGLLLVLALIILMILAYQKPFALVPSPGLAPADFDNITQLGAVLYTDYAYPFELAGLLLLAAIVAAISLAHRSAKQRKTQKISEQLAVRREDRVRLVKMPAEKKNDQS